MKNKFIKVTAISMILVMAMPIQAQDDDPLKDILKDMISQNAEGYLMPAVTAFGSALNSGTFHLGKPHKLLGFDIKINVMLVEIPEIDHTYEFVLSNRVVTIGGIPNPLGGAALALPLAVSDLYQTGVQVPTFVGDVEGAPMNQVPVDVTKARTSLISALATELSMSTADVETFSGAAITDFVSGLGPLPTGPGLLPGVGGAIVPQISIGLPFKIEITARGFSGALDNGDPMELIGYGAKLGLNQFLPNLFWLMPALSVGYYQTNLNLANIITMENSIINFQASKSLPLISVYAGYGMESSTMTIDLTEVVPDANLAPFEITGLNKSRTTIGFRLKLLLLSINGDMSTGEYTTYTLGVGLTLR